MINITRLWTGRSQPADNLRYGQSGGHGHGKAAASAGTRKPIVVWNITRTCNLRCVHCYSDSDRNTYAGELDWEQCLAVIEDLAEYKVPGLLLSGGEPMVHPRFFDIVEEATKRGLKVTISTNGTRITPEKAARLKDFGVAYVGISLDGIGAIHDKFRGVEGCFDSAVKGFRYCRAVEQKTGLRLTLTRHNVECMEQILDFIEKENIPRVCFYHLVPAGRGAQLQTLPPEMSRHALDSLISRVEKWDALGFDREVLTVTQPADGAYLLLRQKRENHRLFEESKKLLAWNGGGAHSSGRGISNIDTQGNIHPDQFWQDISLGNVKREKFSQVWQELAGPGRETLAKIRSQSKIEQSTLSGPCGSCRHFLICGGGFRTRASFANKGSLSASDPGCYLSEQERSEEI